ncbi:MAG: hypothetical protein ACRD7E_15260 [Bryobacteraceae bacterium]
MIGAAKLDAATYEEVEADSSAFRQAIGVVILYGIATGIGTYGRLAVVNLVSVVIAAILGWFFWAWLTYMIGTRLLNTPRTQATWGELLRTTGFATAPGLIGILGAFGPLTGIAVFIANLWIYAAFVVAVRQALDYSSTFRAFGVCFIGWMIQTVILWALISIGPPR